MSVKEAYTTAVLLCVLWARGLAVDPHGAHLRLSHVRHPSHCPLSTSILARHPNSAKACVLPSWSPVCCRSRRGCPCRDQIVRGNLR